MIEARRPASLVFPLVLIVGGALLLLAAAGVLPADAGWRFLQLWPLLLIAIGVQLVVSRTLPVDTARLVALAVIGLLAVGALAYAAFGPALAGGTLRHATSSAPAAGVTQGRLSLATAGTRVHITAAATGDDLYRADLGFSGPAPRVNSYGGTLSISEPPGVRFGRTPVDDLRFTLSSAVPWQIDVAGAGVSGTAELTATPLTSFAMSGVGGNLRLGLGPARGHVPIAVSGVGNTVVLTVPPGTEYDITTSGLGNTSGGRSTAGWSSATDRYDIAVSGIGSKVTVEEGNS